MNEEYKINIEDILTDIKLNTEIEFSTAVTELEKRVKNLKMINAGGGYPFQAEGLLNGVPFYFRYRYGVGSINLGDEPIDNPLYSSNITYGDRTDGDLSSESFIDLFTQLVSTITPAEFIYEFKGNKVEMKGSFKNPTFIETDTIEIFRAGGNSSEEAFDFLKRPSKALLSFGLSEESQKLLFELQRIDPKPLNKDTRIFPETLPVFTVN